MSFPTVTVLAGLWSASAAKQPAAPAELWSALKSGSAFAIMRHALAPGTGDPANFDVGDCATQRNLSDEGRRQATGIGDRFRDRGIAKAEVFTSQWCRCRDTATFLNLGKVRPLSAINSFFQTPEKSEAQTKELKSWLNAYRSNVPLVLVTHQVNITALTGVYPRSGEIVVVQRRSGGRFSVMGSL
ncbi:MAG: histidine phosphatase family protein [Alphaproteobacteria bacterium]